MIKVLQLATVVMFIAIVLGGLLVLIFAPDRMAYFGQLVGILYPIFLAEVVPALIGTPLTDAVRGLVARKAQAGLATPPLATDAPAGP